MIISLCLGLFNVSYNVYINNTAVEDFRNHFQNNIEGKSFDEVLDDLINKGQYESVVEKCNKREKIYPKDIDIFYYRGKAYYYLKNYQKALHDFLTLKEIDSTWYSLVQEYVEDINSDKI